MKDITPSRPRLKLRREALRELTVEDLRRVAGGSQRCMSKLG
jgi:hypothetical protein